MYILGIESSCDETAAAIVEDGKHLISNVISTSVKEQALYGGVVPEIASRRHAEYISATVQQALQDANMTIADVDAVAVTFAPGLIGAVLVGVNFAKGLAYGAGKPLVPVHHLRGHIAANYLTHPQLEPPFLCLVASGGHSHIVQVEDWCKYHVLGRTVDDAAGEAFDKVARTLGLPYPGGPSVSQAAKTGDPHYYKLPTPHVEGKYNVSFSGLKTAVVNEVHNAQQRGEEVRVADMAASFQERIAQILAKPLNAMMMGDSSAVTLGVNLTVVRNVLIGVTALLTASSVAVSGCIGFVGLVIPHLVRSVVGPDHRKLVPLAALFGAIFLIWVDVGARIIKPPAEIPVGILTAFLGAPLFLWMIKVRRYEFQ